MRIRPRPAWPAVPAAALLIVALAVPGVSTAATDTAQAPTYAALGDSYTSGVGTRTYDPDSGDCLRSNTAYPVLSAAAIGADLQFAACSGAQVAGVRNSQLGSLNAQTRYVSVQVGGNDAGFADVITQCALPWPWTCWGDIDEANRIISDVLPGRLDGLYNDIGSRAPNADVVVVGYPRLFNGEECNFLARISPGEQAELNATADRLAASIGGRASAHSFGFVDVRSAFIGHAVCDDVEWINGLSNPVRESYHPNVAGQRDGYAPLVTGALRAPAPVGLPQAALMTDASPNAAPALSAAARAADQAVRPSNTEMRQVYDHLVRLVAPCLRAEGYDPGSAPGWKTFRATYGTADGWNPFEARGDTSDAEWDRVERTCSHLDLLPAAR